MNPRKFLVAFALLTVACGQSEVAASSATQTTIPVTTVATAVSTPTTGSSDLESGIVLVPAGERSDAGLPTATLTLAFPGGWENADYVVNNGLEGRDWANVGFWSPANVFTDRCQWQGSLVDPPPGPGVDDLANALKDAWGEDATAPSDVVLDGFSGQQMVLTVPADADFSQCDEGHFQSWMDDGNGYRWYQGPGQIEQLWILDVDGERLLVAASHYPDGSPESQAEYQQVIGSIQIESR